MARNAWYEQTAAAALSLSLANDYSSVWSFASVDFLFSFVERKSIRSKVGITMRMITWLLYQEGTGYRGMIFVWW